ncbi:MAG: PKD domain-containing protein [Planctomycetota bacterium]|nr:PKD domain-containing protein [Planctomycetota bacterium]
MTAIGGLKIRLGMVALCAAMALCGAARAQVTAVISADQTMGDAPLAVAFDGTGSTGGVTTYFWRFGDGGVSTAASPVHLYNTPGTYVAELTVTDGGSNSDTEEVTIEVTGNGAGPVTPGVNFRLAPTRIQLKLNHAAPNRDSFVFNSVFATIDLPPILINVPFEFSVNGTLVAAGDLNADGEFRQAFNRNTLVPQVNLRVDRHRQTFSIRINRADLAGVFDTSYPPAADGDFTNMLGDVTVLLRIGSQSYEITEALNYTSRAGRTGTGLFQPRGRRGAVRDGFFVIDKASALENPEGTGHFFDVRASIARPNATDDPFTFFTVPVPLDGVMIVTIGGFVDTIPGDRIRGKAGKYLSVVQPERERGGVRHMFLNMATGQLTVKTWDLPATGASGTGLPLKADVFVGYNMVIRVDFEPVIVPPLAFDFQAVTTTRLERINIFDAFWQTGR